MDKTSSNQRGRKAEKPKQIPKKGWQEVALRVKDQFSKDHILIVSAGTAFFFFLAIFPTIAAALSIYGLIMDPVEVGQQMNQLGTILPDQARQVISDILERQSAKSGSALGWSLVLSILISLWTSNIGTRALFKGLNITYNEKDERGFLKVSGISLLFTIGGIIIGFVALGIVVAFPAFINNFGLPSTLERTIQLLRWPILALMVMSALSIVYKVAPSRSNPQIRWASWGAVVATLLWLIGSLLFNLYVSNFGTLDATYGSFAAVIILMLWFFLTAFIILLGAEINAEMEHQTSKDTTIGEDKPMGERGAYHADHVAGEDGIQ